MRSVPGYEFVSGWVDKKTGRPYFRFRRGALSVMLPGRPHASEFDAAYQQARAMVGMSVTIGAPRTLSGSVDAAIVAYYSSAAFQQLAPVTRQQRRYVLEAFRAECGKLPIKKMQRQHLAVILETIKAPHTRRKLRIALQGMLQHALSIGLIEEDPSIGVKTRTPKSDGFKQWDDVAIAVYRAHHKSGTQERLDMEFLYSTGLRRGDAIRVGRQHVKTVELPGYGAADLIILRTGKTGATAHGLITPELAAELAHVPHDRLTFLVGERGLPLTADGFTHRFRQACDAAGLAGYSAHGLRKAAGRRVAEIGGTAHEIAAVLTHASITNTAHYTKDANQLRLLGGVMAKFEKTRAGTTTVKTEAAIVKPVAKLLSK
jgi:integrase